MRTLLTTLLLTALCTCVSAQASYGVRGGFGLSNLRSDAALDLVTDQFGQVSTYSFGAFAEIPLGEVVSLRPGLELAQRGTKLALGTEAAVFGVDLPIGATARTRFTYIDVPLQVVVKLPTDAAITPYAFGGATLGYATGGQIRTAAQAIIEFNLATTDLDLDAINYERFHAAAVGGLGLKAALGAGVSAFVEGRYEQSLTQPYDVPLLRARTGFRGLNFGAGVSFAL